MSFRVAVLVSGEGTNLQAILDSVHGRDGIEVVGVGSNRARGARARAGRRPRASRPASSTLPRYEDRAARDAALGDWLDAHEIDLWCSPASWSCSARTSSAASQGRIVNVHPSLLPAFPGIGAIEQALDHGVQAWPG